MIRPQHIEVNWLIPNLVLFLTSLDGEKSRKKIRRTVDAQVLMGSAMGKRGQIPDIKSFLAVSPSLLTLIYTLVAFPIRFFFSLTKYRGCSGGTLGIFGWAVPPGSPNPDSIDLCHAAPFCLRRFKKLCLCTASLVERTRLALHKKN